MPQVTEIAPDIFRISTFVPDFNLQFNQFLVRDDEPLLFHTGFRAIFPAVMDAVASLIEPARLRWIGFSHVEADECGSLPEWQTLAPQATALCSLVGKLVSVDDCLAIRPAKGLADGETFRTGRFRFRFLHTPHVPHCWEAGFLFEETQRVLFCSDLFHQNGEVEALTRVEIIDRCWRALEEGQRGPLAWYMPYGAQTDRSLRRLAELAPTTLAAMHGSTFVGDGTKAIGDLAVLREILGSE
jgi:flavorubredoxin